MKIMQINCVYGYGSTGKITECIHNELLQRNIDSVVIYGRGPSVRRPGIFRVCTNLYGKINSLFSKISGIPYGGCWLSTLQIFRLIQREQPDAVHLQCINGHFVNIYKLLAYLGKHRIPTVLTLHAEFMFTANCSHAFLCDGWKHGCGNCCSFRTATKSFFLDRTAESFRKMREAFSCFGKDVYVISVSPWLMGRASSSPMLAEMKHCVILNGINTDTFRFRDSSELAQMHHTAGKKVIFHATAMFSDSENHPKGGWYVLELAKRMENEPVIILVAGKYAINGEIPPNVVLLGEIFKQELLAKYYALANITVITSKAETFSMICTESLCCGTPVTGFCAGGPETISLSEYSSFVPFGEVDQLEAKVRYWLKKEIPKEQIADAAAAKYSQERMVSEYEEIYRRLSCCE